MDGPVLVPGRRGGRRRVVEEAVVLVEHQQQHGLGPDLGIGRQGVDHPGGVVRALGGARWPGMLGIPRRRDDVGHLRQLAGQHVLLQPVQQPGLEGQVVEARVRTGDLVGAVAEGLEAFSGVVGEVVGLVLVDAPGHPRRQQPFAIGGPAVGIGMAAHVHEPVVRVGDGRPAQGPGRIDGPGPQVKAVGVGAGLDGAVVGVAEGEGIGQGHWNGMSCWR